MISKLAVDIGGTFTDVVLEAQNRQFAKKLLTTHRDPSLAVLEGVHEIVEVSKVSPEEISMVIHGTTLATNALIERRGAKTALLTTEGHRDILAMAFENRFEQYDVNIERPEPLVPRRLRIPIVERMGVNGNVLRALDLASVNQAIDLLAEEEIESVALGFLHSYVNPDHENTVAELVQKRLPDIDLSLSSVVCPEIREYERLSTTCANAYVLPLMRVYLNRMNERLFEAGFRCPLFMMTSSGGLTTLEVACQHPIRLVESGPAGGAILAAHKAAQIGEDSVLSFDMGGTTAKICLIDKAVPMVSRAFEVDRQYRFKKGSGLPVRIPVIEMVEIGAGGGSIASLDRMSRLNVGPESAGSEPGPACYGRGGTLPTVTDADVTLGKLHPELFAEGELTLDIEAAVQAISNQFGESDFKSQVGRALAINEIVDENMAAAARGHANEWGSSLNDRTLIAYGGAAPLHAARMLEKLKLKRAIIPENAGVGSAVGFLRAPVSYEIVRSQHMLLSELSVSAVQTLTHEMCNEVESVVRLAAPTEELETYCSAFMRYVGQGYEISVPFDPANCDGDALAAAYEQAYERLYGRLIPDSDVEIMSWTVSMSTAPGIVELETQHLVEGSTTETVGHQMFHEIDGETQAQVLVRTDIDVNTSVIGPAIVTERHTTTVVPTGYKLTLNEWNDLVLEEL